MYVCPHCKSRGISFFGKWWSSTAYPTSCSQCNGLSLVPVVTSSGILVGCILGFVLAGLVAAVFKSALFFLAAVPVVACFYIWRWHVAQLLPASATGAAQAKKVGGFLGLFFVFLSFFR